jgi:hypothetical protein
LFFLVEGLFLSGAEAFFCCNRRDLTLRRGCIFSFFSVRAKEEWEWTW